MKRIVLTLLLAIIFQTQCLAAQITFTIPDASVPRVSTALLALYPIPDADGDGNLDYTPANWLKELLRRWIINRVQVYEQKVAAEAVGSDNNLVQ